MTTVTLGILDKATGTLLLDSEIKLTDGRRFADVASERVSQVLTDSGVTMGCANPNELQTFEPEIVTTGTGIQVSGYWHDSLIEGPGRRSVVRMQGCPIKCAGCWVPQTHDAAGGVEVEVATVVRTLLDRAHTRDGVTIVGGEPFAQPRALATLVDALRNEQPDLHITVYSGYTLERLRKISLGSVYILYVLSGIDVLIDGRYIQALKDGAGPWTGSSNQCIHYLSGR